MENISKKLKNRKILNIRRAYPSDASKIVNYLNIVGGESDFLLFDENEYKLSAQEQHDHILNINSSLTSVMICSWIESELVGLCALTSANLSKIAHTSEIMISVKKEYWGLGIGTLMLQEVIEFAKKTKLLKILHLGVRSDNHIAINMYYNRGFEKIGIYKNYFKVDDLYYDKILMNLYI